MTQRRTYFAGEARTGERVRLFPHPRTGVLYLEYRVKGSKKRESTHTTNWDAGKAAAELKADELRRSVIRLDRPTTLGGLFDRWRPAYEAECRLREHPPKAKYFAGVDRLLARARRLLRADAVGLRELTPEHLTLYATARQAAGNENKGPRVGQPLGYAALRAEVKQLRQVLRWGVQRGYLARDPWAGYKVGGVMAEKQYQPRRPIITAEQYQQLVQACDRFTPATSREMCRTFLVLCYETGRRKGAVLALRWSDIDEAGARIRWRRSSDKGRKESWTALTPEALAALAAWRRRRPGVGEALLFPSPHRSREGMPVEEDTVGGWWRRLEELAGLAPEPWRGWHSVRRRVATDLQDAPLSAAAAVLGHSPAVLAGIYQQPGEAMLRQAISARRR